MPKNIASIKSFRFTTPFTLMSSTEFNERVNAQPGLTGIPEIGAIVDNKLLVYPVPAEEEDGESIEFVVSLKSSTVVITKATEPELPEVFDLCLEYFAVSQFLSGKERSQWFNDYKEELRRLRSIEHRKFHTFTRKPITGWS